MIKDPTAVSQRLMWIVWPAFLMAGVLEAVVFARISRSLTMLLAMSPFKVNRCHLPLATCHPTVVEKRVQQTAPDNEDLKSVT